VKLVAATANPGKLVEIEQILGQLGFELVPRPQDLADVVEDAATLEGNARLKAEAVCASAGEAAVADDTGLEVDALDGAPGVHSARYAGEPADSAANIAKLLAELERVGAASAARRRARFRTVVLVRYPDGGERAAEGVVEGTIAGRRRGEGGFGYDSVFVPDEGDGRSFAEMSPAEKHRISHRGRALRALVPLLTPTPRTGQ
jgi:XTP/dITP diphosphohydrolase